MRPFFILFLLDVCQITVAQHCPWDCTGMIMLQTDIPKEKVYKMEPVLVDENKKLITDTLYGTGLPTYDRCDFLEESDFTAYRKKRMSLHYVYQYDTSYYFAEGKYIVHYNFCEYQDKELYLRYNDPVASKLEYAYVAIPASNRIHLHEYNNEIRGRETNKLKQAVKEFVLIMPCAKWGLKKEDCK
jgi:hypothetical protein